MSSKILLFWTSLRPFAFGGSILPLSLGAFLALGQGSFSWERYFISLLGVLSLHAAGNLANDYFDYQKGLDSNKNRRCENPLLTGRLTPSYYHLMMFLLYTLALILGLFLAIRTGWSVFFLGTIGAFSSYFYTAPPVSFKYRGLGAVMVFFLFGPLLSLGGYMAQGETWHVWPFILGIFPGLLMTGVLLSNELMDYEGDREKKILTSAIIMGQETCKKLLLLLFIFPFILLLFLIMGGLLHPMGFLVISSIPFLRGFFCQIAKEEGLSSSLDFSAARLHLLFNSLLIISLFLPLGLN